MARKNVEKSGKAGGQPNPDMPAIKDDVIEWIANGQTLRDFCRQDGMPKRRTIDDWRAANAEFAARFARARDDGYDVIAEDCLRIADTPLAGDIVTVEEGGESGDTTKTVTEDMLGHRKLQVETRLKLLAKWDPRRYGDNLRLDHSGGVQVQLVTGVPPAPPTP